jgi:hypothetical protein
MNTTRTVAWNSEGIGKESPNFVVFSPKAPYATTVVFPQLNLMGR